MQHEKYDVTDMINQAANAFDAWDQDYLQYLLDNANEMAYCNSNQLVGYKNILRSMIAYFDVV